MRPGFLIPAWHNYLKYRLTVRRYGGGGYEIWRNVGFGLWVLDHIAIHSDSERIIKYFYQYAGDRS